MPLSQLAWDGVKWRGYGVPDVDPTNPGGGGSTNRDTLVYGTYKPQDNTTVGLLPNVTLTDGPSSIVTYTETGTATNPKVIQNTTFYNQVKIVNSQYLTFKNCWFKGPPNPSGTNQECVTSSNGSNRNIVFQDCLFRPQNPDYSTSGIKGAHHSTFLRCEFTEVIDGIAFVNGGGDNSGNTDQAFVVAGCWFHDLAYMSPDPDAVGGYTDNAGHVDCIQLRGGYNHYIMGNNFDSFLSSSVGVGYVESDDEYEWSTRGDSTSNAVIFSGKNKYGVTNVQALRHNTGNKYYYYQDTSVSDPVTGYATFAKYAASGPQTKAAWNSAHPNRTLAFPFPQWAAATSVLMMSPQTYGDIGLVFEKNWVDGGAYSINGGDYGNGTTAPYKATTNVTKDMSGNTYAGVTIRNNVWGRGMRGGTTATLIARQSFALNISGNTFADNGSAANMRGNGGA